MANKDRKSKSPITYYYNPFYDTNNKLQFIEVWQVLEDDVLGSLYPWQYVATAEMSNRIVNLNFLALKNFENDYRKYYDQLFVYKVSAKLLSEGNVHRLGSVLQANLILCFDIYQLEKFGDKSAIQGLKFLQNIGATIMISGVDKAPVDVLLKYQANYYLLDYRYYTEQNKGLLTMMKSLADTNAVTLVCGNVNTKDNLEMFASCGIEIFAGSAMVRPRRKIDKFIENADGKQELAMDEQKQKYVVKDVDAPEIKDRAQKDDSAFEAVAINVTSAKDILRARLADAAVKQAEKKQTQKESKPLDVKKEQKKVSQTGEKKEDLRKPRNTPLNLSIKAKDKVVKDKDEKKDDKVDLKKTNKEATAKKLSKSSIATSTGEFASINKQTKQTTKKRGENVIKLNISKPTKKR